MRILLVHKLYELTGGAEVFFRETERVLRESGHEWGDWLLAVTRSRCSSCHTCACRTHGSGPAD